MQIRIDCNDNLNTVEHGFPLYTDISVMSTTHAYSVITSDGLGACNVETTERRWLLFLLWSILLWWRDIHVCLRHGNVQLLVSRYNSVRYFRPRLKHTNMRQVHMRSRYLIRNDNMVYISLDSISETGNNNNNKIFRKHYWRQERNSLYIGDVSQHRIRRKLFHTLLIKLSGLNAGLYITIYTQQKSR
jgi:hypothetical protein